MIARTPEKGPADGRKERGRYGKILYMEKRIFGATDGIRGKAGVWPLRPNAMKALGKAISEYFKQPTLMLGRDTRGSGDWIRKELVAGIEAAGGRVIDLGILPTPAVSAIIKHNPEIDGGIMITASHNPASDNGVKVFRADGEKLSDESELEVEEIYFKQQLGEDVDPSTSMDLDLTPSEQAMEAYCAALTQNFGRMQLDTDLIVDAASGAGQEFNLAVLEYFGARPVVISPEPDGKNINDGHGALYPELLAEQTKARQLSGVAMDGDADRVILADEDGHIWDGDRIVVLLAQYLEDKGLLKNDSVVLTEYSNLGTIKFLESQGIHVDKVVNGDRFVAQLCREQGYTLGGEFSGHIMYMPWLESSDACFVALMTLRIMQEKQCRLADLWSDYEMMPSKQWGLKVREKKPLEEVPGWLEALKVAEEQMAGRGRVFCRYSGTENKLRILVEGEDADLIDECGEKLAEIIKKEIGDE